MARKVSEDYMLSHKRAQPAPSGAGWAVETITYFLRDELHDIDKSFRQDLTVEMLQDIAPTTRTKFVA